MLIQTKAKRRDTRGRAGRLAIIKRGQTMAQTERQCACDKWITDKQPHVESSDGEIYCSIECFNDDIQFMAERPTYKIVK